MSNGASERPLSSFEMNRSVGSSANPTQKERGET